MSSIAALAMDNSHNRKLNRDAIDSLIDVPKMAPRNNKTIIKNYKTIIFKERKL